jgi:hypothetical protein
MSTNLKYFQLLQQIDKNPLKKAVAPAFDIASDFKMDMEAVGLDRRLSPEGRQGQARDHVRKALRDLRDLQKPLAEFRAKTETMRGAVKRPSFDKSDFVAAMNRRELRDRSCQMNFGRRAGRMIGPNRDIAFIDAVLEHEAWVSGFDDNNPNEVQIFETAKQERLRDLHGALIDEVTERESTESEAAMIIAVARVDIQGDSGLESARFEAFAKPIESKAGAPWVMEDGKTICEVVNGKPEYHQGTPDELRDAKPYPNPESYLADRAA